MGSERFWRIVFLAAAAHNILGGLAVLFLGDWAYARAGLPPPASDVNYVRWGLLILVFGCIYVMVYRDLLNSRNLVVVGILGKLASATPDVYYLLFRTGVPRIFWITVFTNYAFIVLFLLFLRFLGKAPAEGGGIESR